jgi:hypothetical protein
MHTHTDHSFICMQIERNKARAVLAYLQAENKFKAFLRTHVAAVAQPLARAHPPRFPPIMHAKYQIPRRP